MSILITGINKFNRQQTEDLVLSEALKDDDFFLKRIEEKKKEFQDKEGEFDRVGFLMEVSTLCELRAMDVQKEIELRQSLPFQTPEAGE